MRQFACWVTAGCLFLALWARQSYWVGQRWVEHVEQFSFLLHCSWTPFYGGYVRTSWKRKTGWNHWGLFRIFIYRPQAWTHRPDPSWLECLFSHRGLLPPTCLSCLSHPWLQLLPTSHTCGCPKRAVHFLTPTLAPLMFSLTGMYFTPSLLACYLSLYSFPQDPTWISLPLWSPSKVPCSHT